MPSTENIGGYKTEVSELIYEMERLAPRYIMQEKMNFDTCGGLLQ